MSYLFLSCIIFVFSAYAVAQPFRPTLLLQVQTAAVNDGDEHKSDSEVRRERFGVKSDLTSNVHLSGTANVKLEDGDFYENHSQVYLRYSWFGNSKKEFIKGALYLGKLKPRFGREYTTPAKKLLTVERSFFSSLLAPRKTSGAEIIGFITETVWLSFGIYSGERDDGWSSFSDQDPVLILKIKQKLSDEWRLLTDVLLPTGEQEITYPTDGGLSLTLEYQKKETATWSGWWEVAGVKKHGEGNNLWSTTLHAHKNSGEGGTWVLRGHLLQKKGGTGLPKRYERMLEQVGDEDLYASLYVGYNHTLKESPWIELKVGLEQSTYAFTGFTGLQLSL